MSRHVFGNDHVCCAEMHDIDICIKVLLADTCLLHNHHKVWQSQLVLRLGYNLRLNYMLMFRQLQDIPCPYHRLLDTAKSLEY